MLNGIRQVDGTIAFGKVLLVNGFDGLHLPLDGFDEGIWEGCDAVSAAFAVAYDDLTVVEVDVFDAEAQAFHDAQAAAIHDLDGELVDALEAAYYAFDLFFR